MYQNLGDCSIGTAGTGVSRCSKVTKGNDIGLILVDKNTKISNINKATIDALVLDGKAHIIKNSVGAEYSDNEDTFSTSSTLVQAKSQDAKPTQTYKFWEGPCFYNNVKTLETNGEFDVFKIFEKGIELVNYSDTQLKGFDLGMVTIPHYKEQQGGDVAETMVKIQYINPAELHSKRIFYLWENLDFKLNDITGIYQTVIKLVTNTAGILIFKVLDACTGKDITDIIPAIADSFTLTGGSISTVTFQPDNTIEIIYTGTATAIKLNIVEDVAGNKYKSDYLNV